jgi:PAS domain S-box-containing protein
MASGTAPTAILEQLVVSLESLMPEARCSILLVSEDGRTLRHGAAPNLPAAYCEEIDGIVIGERAGSCGTAAHLRTLVIVEDTHTDQRWAAFREQAIQHGLRACWSSPIIAPSGEVLGTFAVYHGERYGPTPRDIALLQRFSGLAAVAIRHASMLRELGASERRFRSVFDDNAAGMALIDLDGRILRTNSAFCAIAARTTDELAGLPFADLLATRTADQTCSALECVAAGQSDRAQLEVVIDRNGIGPALALLALSLIRDPEGSPRHLCASLLDDTERYRAEEERRAAQAGRAAAEQQSLARGQLLSSMSHELRTPLSSIVGFCELLRTVDLPPNRRESAVAHLTEAARHLLELVEDLLNLAQLEAGGAEVRLSATEIAPVIADAIAILEPLALDRHVEVRTELGDGLVARADRRWLRQALLNLIGNAIKFNRTGGSVDIAVESSGDHVLIDVRDTGPGVPDLADELLYRPFERLGRQQTEVPGTGLGLTISKQFIEAMDGQLQVTARREGGTRATVELPVADTPARGAAARASR